MKNFKQIFNDKNHVRNEIEEDVYSNLFSYTSNRAEKLNSNFSLPEKAFICSIYQHPDYVYPNAFQHFSKLEYMYTMFWCMYRRLPNKKDLHYWNKIAKRNDEDIYKLKITKAFKRRMESTQKKVYITEHIPDDFNTLESEEWEKIKGKYSFLPRLIGMAEYYLYIVYFYTLRPVKVFIFNKLGVNK